MPGTMLAEYWDQLRIATWNAVWAVNLSTVSRGRASVIRVVRIGHMLGREFGEGELSVRAASLVYTTLLSLVPLLAVTFAMLKTFGVHQDFEPWIMRALEPLGDRGGEIGAKLIEFVENLQVGGLGAMGIAVLLFTIVSLVHKVERSFNYAWRLRDHRGLLERFSRYLTVVMVGPVLVFTALAIIGSVTSEKIYQDAVAVPAIATAVDLGGKLVPFLLVVAAFTFTYVYIPNTSVRVRSALAGALFAGLLWVVAGWFFAELVVTSSRYTAIYRSFALLILFMMWLYIAWLILLVGASVAFYHQHPEYVGLLRHELRASNRIKERMALGLCARVASRFLRGEPPWNVRELSTAMQVPHGLVEDTIAALVRAGVLVRADGETPRYLPARDLATTSVSDVLEAVRAAHESAHHTGRWLPDEPAADAVMASVESGIESALGTRTLRELADAVTADGAGDGERVAPVTAITRDGAL